MDNKDFNSIWEAFFVNAHLALNEDDFKKPIKVRSDIPFQFNVPVTCTNADPTLTVFHEPTDVEHPDR